jgi:GNAT superfamily N-acetyltransferase
MEKKETIVRKAVPADIPAVHILIKELAAYEKAPDEVEVTEQQLLEDGFGKNPAYELIVAETNGEISGIALFYIRYSTWKGRALYLEDLVVREAHRRKGIGNLLFEEILRIARERNYSGVVWQVLDWNEPALNFYGKYKASFSGEWLNGRVSVPSL